MRHVSNLMFLWIGGVVMISAKIENKRRHALMKVAAVLEATRCFRNPLET